MECNHSRKLSLFAKCCDTCTFKLDDIVHQGYCPKNVNCGNHGDYIEISVCALCGYMDGKWPLEENVLADQPDDDD